MPDLRGFGNPVGLYTKKIYERLLITILTSTFFMQTTKKYYRVDRREIAFIKFIFEAYDGMAIVETIDPGSGVILFHIAPGCEDDVETILKSLNLMVSEIDDCTGYASAFHVN